MRYHLIAIAVLGVTLLGCEESHEGEVNVDAGGADAETSVVVESDTQSAAQEGAVSGADVGRDLSEALGTVGQYAAQKQDDLIEASGKKLAEMDDDIQRLKQKGAALGGAARSRWEQMKIDLEKKAAAAKEELAKAKVAGAAALEEASVELSKAMQEVGSAYDEAAKDFEGALESPESPESPAEGTPIQP